MLYIQPSAMPTRKITGVGIGGAVSLILIWALEAYILPDPLPAEVAGAITLLISWGVGYYVRESDGR